MLSSFLSIEKNIGARKKKGEKKGQKKTSMKLCALKDEECNFEWDMHTSNIWFTYVWRRGHKFTHLCGCAKMGYNVPQEGHVHPQE